MHKYVLSTTLILRKENIPTTILCQKPFLIQPQLQRYHQASPNFEHNGALLDP